MLWGPVVSGFLLPSLINSIYDPAFLIDLAKESDEFAIMMSLNPYRKSVLRRPEKSEFLTGENLSLKKCF